MSPPWIVFAAALFANAVCGSFVDASARVAAAVGLLALAARCGRRHRNTLLIAGGFALGALAARRMDGPVAEARGREGDQAQARFAVTASLGDGRAEGWLVTPGRPAARARLSGLPPDVGPGGLGTATLRVTAVGPPRNPDDRDARRQALAGRTLLRARVRGDVRLHQRSAPSARQRLKGRLVRAWERGMGDAAPLWAALLLGERLDLDPEVDTRFRTLGQTHLLSISGTHVALVAGLALALTRRMPRVRAWLPLTLVVAWTCLVGFIPPLARAVGMAAWVAVARRMGRPARAIDALAAVGVVELAWRPWHLAGLTWWLTYAATAGLCLAVRALAGRPKWVQGVGVSLAAQGATLPWMLGTFGAVPWAATLHYMVLGPVFGALMAAGVALTLVAALVAPLAAGSLALLAASTHVAGLVMLGLSRATPPAVTHPGLVGPAWSGALVVLAVWLIPELVPLRWVRLGVTAGALLLAHAGVWKADTARWTMLDVGQGDATVLRAGRRHWLVIDAGPASPTWDAGQRVVVPYLARRGAARITLALTHGHLDHTGGAAALIRTGRVGRLVIAACDTGAAWALGLRALGARHGVRLRALARGDTLHVGDLWIDCWWPPPQVRGLHSNDRSLVLLPRLDGGLLLTGDLERIGERAIVDEAPPEMPLPSHSLLLKVAHHGGNTGTDAEWLAGVRPALAWISCGTGNRYGHPHAATLDRLSRCGATIWRTDQDGALQARWRGGRFQIRAMLRGARWAVPDALQRAPARAAGGRLDAPPDGPYPAAASAGPTRSGTVQLPRQSSGERP